MGQEEFLKKLRETFKIEAQEYLQGITLGLLELEKSPPVERQTEIVETIFRQAHSLKGAARSVNFGEVGAVCQKLEDILADLKRQYTQPAPGWFDTLHAVLDDLGRLVAAGPGKTSSVQVGPLIEQLTRLKDKASDPTPPKPLALESPAPPASEPLETQTGSDSPDLLPAKAVQDNTSLKRPSPTPAKTTTDNPGAKQPALPTTNTGADQSAAFVSPQASSANKSTHSRDAQSFIAYTKDAKTDTIRISAAKLDTLLLQVEEMLSVKLTTRQRAIDLKKVTDNLLVWHKAWRQIQPEIQKISRTARKSSPADPQVATRTPLNKLLEFAEWNQTYLEAFQETLDDLAYATDQDQRWIGTRVDSLLEDMKKALMMPFSSLLQIFPKMVRDMARAQNKQVDLILDGAEVEIDRRILEAIKDPLIHLVRNCIDHGIEPPAERGRLDKPAQGSIKIVISQLEGSNIELLVEDDGAGIDLSKVTEMAMNQGFISKQEAANLEPDEAMSLIFRSSLSTSQIITDVSGRGLGMAIVQEKIEKLGGIISVTSSRHVGSTFRILLPVTMAIFRGVLVKAADRTVVAPTMGIERVVRLAPEEIKSVQGEQTIKLDGQVISLVSLAQILELQPPQKRDDSPPEFVVVLVLNAAGRRIAMSVDKILYEQEVLIKGLGQQLRRVRNIAGVAVFGSGQIIPVLNVSDVVKSAIFRKTAPAEQEAMSASPQNNAQKSILVVEDSITSRTLLRNVLEAAGYQVTTCVDGVDARSILKTEPFDLMVSDIEMPRMNGFELTEAVRADQDLANLPIVLVTSLSDPEDRERGVDAGADAYIIKSTFDQINLLQTISRLI